MKSFLSLFFSALCLFLSACATPSKNVITQVSTLDALLAGEYVGSVRLDELRENGDIGLGAFNQLDGEMIFLDGIFYQVDMQGKVTEMPGETLTPFAAVTDFEPNIFADIDQPVDMEALARLIDGLVPDQNHFVIMRIEGDFSRIQTRSVPAQTPPYRPLAEVVKKQAVFDFENIKGTLVGFRCPPYVKKVNVPGYHFHFLTSDQSGGGHVLSLELASGTLAADTIHHELAVILPQETNPSGIPDLSSGSPNIPESVGKE